MRNHHVLTLPSKEHRPESVDPEKKTRNPQHCQTGGEKSASLEPWAEVQNDCSYAVEAVEERESKKRQVNQRAE
jgi:hypothetical protein